MDKRLKRHLAAFQNIQRKNGQYHISPLTPHEQAIREHKTRGHGEGLLRQAGLLDHRNKVQGL